MPSIFNRCIQSWQQWCPEFTIVRWDESTFDIESSLFTKTAYSMKHFSKVSNYVRAHALHAMGGIYVDTDVEIKSNLLRFLEHEAFSGFETQGLPFTAVWGSVPAHPWPARVLTEY
jgi:mannosyltransferase OCH1-like enzyme